LLIGKTVVVGATGAVGVGATGGVIV